MYDLSGELTVIPIGIWWLQKLRKDWQLSKEATQKSDLETMNLRKQSELEVRIQYKNAISSRFAALENFNDSEDIKRA
jgi:hypothetical protein